MNVDEDTWAFKHKIYAYIYTYIWERTAINIYKVKITKMSFSWNNVWVYNYKC